MSLFYPINQRVARPDPTRYLSLFCSVNGARERAFPIGIYSNLLVRNAIKKMNKVALSSVEANQLRIYLADSMVSG